MIWTSPNGPTYTTHPGSKLLFPTWNTTTATLPPPPTNPPNPPERALMMPKRKRTRAAQFAARITAERTRTTTPAPF
ncbi:hypothetical protein [Mycolicibacterium sp. GF69]|uniref:hypothetical protein n=1 Tax=Mycolicibacterium sp. GF69 TaxID=2267251 RepID=UPI001F0C4ADA|nr:hypothetical protein [Mycolicibacterium sp. GF69]